MNIFSKAHPWELLVWCAILLFIVLRFINLEADFPAGVTWSGALYTDEGWYCNNATNYMLFDKWYVEGDSNLGVNFPLFTIMQIIFFKLFGLSLPTARLPIAISFAMLICFTYLFLKNTGNHRLGLIASLLMAVNFFMFAYSRLALGEVPMLALTMLSFLMLTLGKGKQKYLFTSLSALSLFAAALVKSTGLMYALPVTLYLIWKDDPENKSRIWHSVTFLLTLTVCCGLLYILFLRKYWGDFTQLYIHNYIVRFEGGESSLLAAIKAFLNGYRIGYILFPVSVIAGGILFWKSRSFRENKLTMVSLVWILMSILMLGINRYYPPRYFIPMAVPVIILFSLSLERIVKKTKRAFVSILLIILTILSCVYNSYRVGSYLLNPEYSFIEMCRDVKTKIGEDVDGNPVIMGSFANTASIATGYFAINDDPELFDLRSRIEKYKPGYYISVGGMLPEVTKYVDEFYQSDLIRTYDVFNNYLDGEPVYFYELNHKEESKTNAEENGRPLVEVSKTNKDEWRGDGYLYDYESPKVLVKVDPFYPAEAEQRGIEGVVLVEVLIGLEGHVDSAIVIEARPEGIFEEKALEAVRQWLFTPAEYRGKPVKGWYQIPIQFKLK